MTELNQMFNVMRTLKEHRKTRNRPMPKGG